jgi:hypothetical protein
MSVWVDLLRGRRIDTLGNCSTTMSVSRLDIRHMKVLPTCLGQEMAEEVSSPSAQSFEPLYPICSVEVKSLRPSKGLNGHPATGASRFSRR